MKLIMSDPTEKEKIRMREDARRDEITQLEAAKRIGKEEGIEEGIEKNKRDNARRMKEDGVDVTLISKYTGLTSDQISQL